MGLYEFDGLTKYWLIELGEDGKEYPVRYMTPAELKEREALNIANTASALRARVIGEYAKLNGHSKPQL